MKKVLWLYLILMLTIPLSAQRVWTVKTVPNTRLESDLIHVSDPDDILSDSCEQLINTALSAIRDQADVFVVALESIGDADIDLFANELFNRWGIGDREKDNGVLILLAKEQRELKFETGYGVEDDLPDARCQEIFLHYIVPFFKEGDYQSGLCSGVTQIVDVFGGEIPDGLLTVLPSQQEEEEEEEGGDISGAEMLLALLLFGMPVIGFFILLFQVQKKPVVTGKTSNVMQTAIVDGVRYVNGRSGNWDGNPWGGVGCLKAMLFGLSPIPIFFIVFFIEGWRMGGTENISYSRILLVTVLVFLTWICIRQNWRALRVANKNAKGDPFPKSLYEQADKNSLTRLTRWLAIWVGWIFILIFKHKINKTPGCQCAECGSEMNAFNRFHFNPVQQKEMELKSVEYDPYICQYGHVTVLKNYRLSGTRYQVCPNCKGRTEREVNSKVVRAADYKSTGLKEITYHCEFCGTTRVVEETIPKLVHSYSGSSSSSSSSSRSYHSSSSHHSGGSFGGGRSGGGGYRGSW
ncbi:MAG: TPM domain-containing protein [Bacteroidales bacterium]|nr:TPM domain-containing protein [Bacteroidales bacterium]MBR5082402.1 TPM domain-containing protein [Bacteroidales bacterium]